MINIINIIRQDKNKRKFQKNQFLGFASKEKHTKIEIIT